SEPSPLHTSLSVRAHPAGPSAYRPAAAMRVYRFGPRPGGDDVTPGRLPGVFGPPSASQELGDRREPDRDDDPAEHGGREGPAEASPDPAPDRRTHAQHQCRDPGDVGGEHE